MTNTILETLCTASVIITLIVVIGTLINARINRIENKVDWLLMKAGNDYPNGKNKKEGGTK